jgi:hypothetical protein
MDALFNGSVARSAPLRAEYQRLADSLPFGSDKVMPELTDAIVAIESGRPAEALPVLQRVLTHLPPGPIGAASLFPVRQPRTLVAYWSGRAQLGAGDDAEAARSFTRVVDAGWSRLFTPFEYVRSFYYLGQIAEKQGDRTRAREYYGTFLKYWKDGDIDRDKVQDALKKIAS